MSRRIVRRGVGLLPVLALVLAACTSGTDKRSAPTPTTEVTSTPTVTPSATGTSTPEPAYYKQKLTWKGCGSGFQCSTLKVPLDYANPASELIAIAVIRLKATGSRRGALLVNPGGPGGSGVDYARSKPATKAVREHFDIVGFDPRGVGKSTPVRCNTTKFLDGYLLADASPDTPAEHQELVDLSRKFAENCKAKAAKLLPYVSTENAARDMDVLRAALGDARLTYLGKSYGTYLGAVYANLFPSRVRALVLDGAVDPTLTTEQLNRTQARGFETALDAFLADCVKRSSCPLGTSSVSDARARLTRFVDSLDSRPLPTSRYNEADGRELTQAQGILGIATAMYDKGSWSYLRDGLKEALGGDGATLLYFGDQLVDRHDHAYSNQSDANMAVNCLDHPAPQDIAAYDKDAAEWAKESPVFGSFLAYGSLPCAYWPVRRTGGETPLTAVGAPPLLVIGTLRDPATPYSWSVALANQLSSGRLLTYNGDGHTVYGDGNACVDRATDAYLLDLTVPPEGKRC